MLIIRKMNYKELISKLINNSLVTENDITLAAEGHGDFALPCFKYARELRKAPQAPQLGQRANAGILALS